MSQATADLDVYLSDFARAEREWPPSQPGWLAERRREAIASFERAGFPSSRDEEWRQTPVSALTGTPFRAAGATGAEQPTARTAASPLADLGLPRIVFVNGRYEPRLSRTGGEGPVWAGPLAEALAVHGEALERCLARIAVPERRPFAALATALFPDAAVIFAGPATESATPIHVLHLVVPVPGPVAVYPRTLVIAGPGSRVSVVEAHLGEPGGPCLASAVTEIEVGDGASVEHCLVQDGGDSALRVATLQARQDRDSRFVSHNVALGAALARIETGSVLAGEGADCVLNGLYVVEGTSHVDNHTSVEHSVPHGTSHQLYKGILGGAARAVFNGRITVSPGAQKTDAFQSNRNLLLSDEALVFTRPQLEIHADDVRCTHGAAVGQLDSEALFYLTSRGIGAADARHLLVDAFTGEVLERIGYLPLRDRLLREVTSRTPATRDSRGIR